MMIILLVDVAISPFWHLWKKNSRLISRRFLQWNLKMMESTTVFTFGHESTTKLRLFALEIIRRIRRTDNHSIQLNQLYVYIQLSLTKKLNRTDMEFHSSTLSLLLSLYFIRIISTPRMKNFWTSSIECLPVTFFYFPQKNYTIESK